MSRLMLLYFVLIIALPTKAQLTHDGRGMYVDKFFRTSTGSNGAAIVDANFSILSIPAKENALLQYARDNHITYLILYDLHRVFGNSTYEGYLCSFMQKAKTQYCIEKIGVASSCAAMFENVADVSASPPVAIPVNKSSAFNQHFSYLKKSYSAGDEQFLRSEVAKLSMRTTTFNDSCPYKFDVLVTEFEFWNSGTDNCTEQSLTKDQKYANYQAMITDMDSIRDGYNSTHTHQIYVETYLGYLNQNTNYTHQAIADWVDGSYNGKRRVDRVNQHYYSTDAVKLYSRTASGQNNSGFYLTRFLDFCQPSTNNQTEVMPILSAENSSWGAAQSFLGSWFGQSPNNNIFTAEKIWYNDWYDDAVNYHPTTVGSSVAGNVIRPGEFLWFTAGQMSGHLDNPLMFTSNSPVCVSSGQADLQFQYLGPTEQGVSFKFYLTNAGTSVVRCGSTASIPWPVYNPSTQTGIDLNAALNSCQLPVGDYDAHLELKYDSCHTYIAPVQTVSVGVTGKIVALTSTTACQGNPVYLQASSTFGGTTTYTWYDGVNPITGATSSFYAPSSTGTHNYSCKITSSVAGCSANLSNVIPVTINTYPAASITVQSTTACTVVLKGNPTSSTYVWQNGSTSSTFSTSQAGTYSVAVTKSGCTSTASYSYKKVKMDLVQSVNPCQGSSNGSITVNLYWGTSPYTVSWTGPVPGSSSGNAAGNKTISNLSAGSYNLTVTDANGCTNTLSVTLATSVIASISSDTSICVGDTLYLFSSGGSSYSWTGPNSFQSAIQNPKIINSVVANSGLYRVTVTGASGCTSSASITLNVYAHPTSTVSINSPVCVGKPVQISVTGGNSYSWSGPAGFTSTTATNTIPAAAVNNAGTYSVVVTESHGCTTSASAPLVVNVNPVASITGDSVLCENDTLILNAVGGTTYSWTGPGGFNSTLSSITINHPLTGNSGLYSVVVTNSSGCTATASRNVGVYALPSSSITLNSPVCEGQTVQMSVAGGYSYSWSGPAGFTSSTATNTIPNVTLNNAGTYSVIVTESHGCSSGSSAPLVVNVNPVASITGDSVLCENDSLVLNAAGGSNYSWTGPSGFTSSSTEIILNNTTMNNSGLYSVNVSNASGCSASASIVVAVYTNPVVVPSGPNSICGGEDISLNASGGFGYQWTGPSGFSSSLQSPVISPGTAANEGVYIVIASNEHGCSDSASVQVAVTIPVLYYADADSDGFGDDALTLLTCLSSGIYTAVSGGDCNDHNSLIHPGAVEICGNGIDEDCDGIADDSCTSLLQLKVFIEGFYDGNGLMSPVVNPTAFPLLCDTVLVELHQSTSPYNFMYASKNTIDVYGTGTFSFPASASGDYFVVIKHRNTLETWSSQPVFFNGIPVVYDFTDTSSKAYGNNQVDLGDGNFAIYSGDIDAGGGMGHDGIIDYADFLRMKNALNYFLTGYQHCDLNGDGIVETSDYSIVEKNASILPEVQRP